MSKFTCLVLCVVAATFSRVYAGAKEKAAIKENARVIFLDCAKEHGVSDAELRAAFEAQNLNNIKSCFLGCVYKKEGLINDKGKFDLDIALDLLKEFNSDKKEYAEFVEIGKKCTAVNQKPVSDGTAGCERAALLTACIMKHKDEVTFLNSSRN